MNPDNLILYVLVRTDMPSMKYGKGAAQAAHAANQFIDTHLLKPLLAERAAAGETPWTPPEDIMLWRSQANGFGTKLTLDVDGSRLRRVIDVAQKLGWTADLVWDPTYPYIVDSEVYGVIQNADRRLVEAGQPSLHTKEPVPLGKGQFLLFRREYTCGYLFGDKDLMSILLRQFNLLDNT